MAPHDRPSPRSCIRDWLLHTESNVTDEQNIIEAFNRHGKARRKSSHSQEHRNIDDRGPRDELNQSKQTNRKDAGGIRREDGK